MLLSEYIQQLSEYLKDGDFTILSYSAGPQDFTPPFPEKYTCNDEGELSDGMNIGETYWCFDL